MTLKERFESEALSENGSPLKGGDLLVVAVRLPSGHLETITNMGDEEVQSKIKDLVDNYDNDFRLRTNRAVKIEGYLLV